MPAPPRRIWPGCRPRLAEWKLDVTITQRRDGDNALAIIAVQGPNARAKVWEVLPQAKAATEGLKAFFAAEVGQYFIASTGYTGEDGYEIMLPADEAEALWNKLHAAGVAPCGLGARDTLRLEAGMNLYGQDMDETRFTARRRPGLDGRHEGPSAISSASRR